MSSHGYSYVAGKATAPSSPGPHESDEDRSATFQQLAKTYSLRCLGCCCVLLVTLLIIVMFAGWNLVSMSTNKLLEQDPTWTPVMFPRYSSCGGCREGNKTDEELQQCIKPCYNLSFVQSWESFNIKHGFKLVYFPSRKGPNGEPPVNISAWWLPAASRPGDSSPRIVALHGLASNNNHCGVQATCFLLREMGFSCLAPSVRDFGLSGASSHPDILTWGYDYHLDLLGAWDYAIDDPDGIMGGKMSEDQVGVMGFSKGAYAAAIAMAMEPRISAAWLDSGPFHGLRGSIISTIEMYVGSFLASILGPPVFWSAQYFSGYKVDRFDPIKLLSLQCPKLRHVMVSQSSIDDVVPISETQYAALVLSGMPDCYQVVSYTPPEYCNGAKHHQEMWEFPDDTRFELCEFWSRSFQREKSFCQLQAQPDFQMWSALENLPPGSPTPV